MWRKLVWLAVILVFLGRVFGGGVTYAESEGEKLENLSRQIEEYNRKIVELQAKAGTLSNQIAQFDAQIHLTELKINQTQEQILLLGGRIDQLELSLNDLAEAFSSRVVETYRMTRLNEVALYLFSAPDVSRAVARFRYLQKIQEADRNLLSRLQFAQNSYKEQRGELEELEQTLGEQKKELDNQKTAKNNLLRLTKNDEKQYQGLLAAARAEFEAIQAIIAGRGVETEVGPVKEGERIATIIQGASCNSSNSHLHFMVVRNASTENPFNFLGPIDYENCSGPGECSAADVFNPGGSWSWPINPKVRFTQGYGSTWAVANTWVGRIYQFHNGIDINNGGDSTVKAVKAGKLFRGSYTGYNGCGLRYVRVDHDENEIDTYYLHINY